MFESNNKRKTINQTFRITDEEKKALNEGAERNSMTIADFIRYCIKSELKNEKYNQKK